MSSPVRRPRRSLGTHFRRSSDSDLPLRIALTYLLVRVHPWGPDGTHLNIYSSSFTGSILQVVAREAFEVDPVPASFPALKHEVDVLNQAESASIARTNDKLLSRGQAVTQDRIDAGNPESWLETFAGSFDSIAEGCAFLDSLEKDIRGRMNEDDEEDLTETPEPFERRSPFGLFLRNVLLTLRKLSFDETSLLSHQIASWCGTNPAGPSRTPLHHLSLNRKLAMEDTLDKRVSAIQEYQRATDAGDYSKALGSLRRFYDYQFPGSGQGQHQHALLSLAAFHYSQGGLAAAQSSIDEAIRVARAENDRSCLKHCMSLLHRLQLETRSSAFLPAETPRILQQPLAQTRLPRSTNPLDDLWSLKAAVDMGEPAHVAMRRIHLALARQDQAVSRTPGKHDVRESSKIHRSFPTSAWHATQAGLWSMMGCTDLAVLHEDLAMEASAGDADTRLTVLLSRADRLVMRGKYDEALAMLLDHSILDRMNMACYHRWARKVWYILERQASLSGDVEAVDIVLALKPSGELSGRLGPGGTLRETGQPLSFSGMADPSLRGIPIVNEQIISDLSKARKLKDADAPANLVLPPVLSSIELASQLGLWPIYRSGIILLGEALLSMEGQCMGFKAREEIETIWEQILVGDDEEDMARAALVLAKADIEAGLDTNTLEDNTDSIENHLHRALRSAKAIGSRDLSLQVLTLSGLLGEATGRPSDEWTKQWNLEKQGDQSRLAGMKDSIRRVGEVVKLVGVKVAEGWAA